MSGATVVAKRVFVAGLVQGVGYRAWAVVTADGFGLDGWVRNRLDGRVELLLKGLPDAVEAMIEACREGPLAADVSDVSVAEAKGIVVAGFVSKPTV